MLPFVPISAESPTLKVEEGSFEFDWKRVSRSLLVRGDGCSLVVFRYPENRSDQ